MGKVTDAKTNVSLIGANVSLTNKTTLGTSTDSKGNFKMENITPGTYELKVAYQGYFPFIEKIEITSGTVLDLKIELQINVKELTAVEIWDDKIENHPYSKITIKKAELDQVPVRDMGDFLRSIPNISAVRKGGANLDPVIRGFKFDQLNVQLDNGQTMEGGCPNRMDPTAAHVEATDIEAIEVLKGPFALRYGPTMGGVINMITLNPRPFDKFQIHVKGNMGFESNWNGQRQHITVLGGGQKVFFSLTGNNSDYGNYQDGNGDMIKSTFRKMGYTGKLGFAPAKNHIIYLTYSEFYARDVAFLALPMDERTDNTNLASIDYKAKDISKTISSIEFKGYYSNVHHIMDNNERSLSDTASAIADIIAKKIGYRFEAGLNIGGGHLFVGSDYYKIDKDGLRSKYMIGQIPTTLGMIPYKLESLWNQAVINNIGFFTEYNKKISSWEIVGALRVDLNSAFSDSISLMSVAAPGAPSVDLMGIPADSTKSNYTNLSFSAGISRNITENLNIGASIGRGVRSPGMLERFIISLPTGYDNYEYIGNPTLMPEANNEFDLILKYQKEEIGTFEITGFYSMINNYIGGVFIPKTLQKPLTAQVLGVKRFENLGDATMSGFEFGYASPIKNKWKITATAAYTMGNIKEIEVIEFDANNNAIGSEIVKNDPLAEIPPFEGKINFSYKFFKGKLVPELGFRYVAAQNRISKASLEPTSPAFNLLNFNILYKYNDYLDISAGVNNILDTYYTEHLNRRVLGTDYRIAEPGRIIFVNLNFNF